MIDKLIEPVTHILDKFVADKDLKAKLDHEIKTQFHKIDLAQIEVNKIEASHRSIFVAGWRPCCGWICAIALGYHFVLQPIILFVFLNFIDHQNALFFLTSFNLLTIYFFV